MRDIDVAIALSRIAYSNESSRLDRFLEVRERVGRLTRRSSKGTKDAEFARQFSGTYQRSTGFEGHTLDLNADGTFKFSGQSDAIDMCTGGRWTFAGSFHFEEGYLAVEPGPTMKRSGIDAPDLFVPVVEGDRAYLVEESQLAYFCKMERAGKLPPGYRMFYVGPTPEGAADHMSDARAVCADRE